MQPQLDFQLETWVEAADHTRLTTVVSYRQQFILRSSMSISPKFIQYNRLKNILGEYILIMKNFCGILRSRTMSSTKVKYDAVIQVILLISLVKLRV